MKLQLECPVCEQRFTVGSESAGKKVKCPGCSRSFNLPPKKKANKPAPIQPAASAPPPKPLPMAQPLAPASADDQPAINQGPSQVRTGKPSALASAKAKRKRKKRQMIRSIAVILGLATIVGILSGILVMRLQKQAKQGNAAAEPMTKNADQAGSDSKSDISAEVTQTDSSPALPQIKQEKPKPEKKIIHEELAPQEFFYHDSKKVEKCWELVRQHLVNLTVYDSFGTHKAIGTIVDSRGWIVTSYSAIKGASKIEVTPGYKTIDQFYLPPSLTDSVRGVVILDPAQDLAVLSINRRFIESFANITVTEKDFVVDGEFLMQCGSPTPNNVYACYESKIAISGKFADLPETSKAVAKSKQLTSAELPWIVCQDLQKALPGAPLVRINGTLEAIHVFTIDDQAHYVPVHLLKPLLKKASEETQPLSVLGGSSDEESDSSKIAVSVDHPIRKSSVQLNRLTSLCEQFNWIAKNKSEYDQLQDFSQHFVTALKYVKENQKSEPELTEELQRQLKEIKKSISAGINKADLDSVKTMNEFAAADLNKTNQIIPFYGRVIELEVSVGNDILKLMKAEPSANVALNPDQTRERFNRRDVCMAFVEVPGELVRRAYKKDDEKVSSVVVDLITRINVSK